MGRQNKNNKLILRKIKYNMNMKKYLNINTFCVVTMGLAMVTSLIVGNVSAFLGWLTAFIYALKEMYSESVA